MQYRHKKTGTIIDFKSEIVGGNWEKVVAHTPEKKTPARKTKGAPKK